MKSLLILMFALVLVAYATGEELYPGAAIIEYFGYSNCILLENPDCKVILTPEIGGKILEYSWQGENVLWISEEEKGWKYEEGNSIISCAGRFDIGPEMIIPSHPILWFGQWNGEITGPRKARLTSKNDPNTGVRLIREFTLDENSSHLVCTQIIENISNESVSYCHWGRTFAVGEGIVVLPVSENTRFPNHYIMYGSDKVIYYKPVDGNIIKKENYLIITGPPKYPKLGFDSYEGWFTYLMKNNLMFVKKFATFPDKVYNEMAGITVSIWYPKDFHGSTVCELEPIGPRENLLPGESASFVEEWFLQPFVFPEKTENIELEKIQREVEKINWDTNLSSQQTDK